ncbi:MAG: hypothetical protein ACMVY4_13045 [Minwuia sp.]|uniref:hypothetical protein n=1 Tax=Minwuia sp. TaxID=2493630 RepID=UPI003A879317
MTIGDGLAALAFWGFVTAIILAGIVYSASNRKLQHDTLRRLIESGQPVDAALRDRLLAMGDDGGERLVRGLKIGGIVVLSAAPGLAILGLLLSELAAWLQPALMGTALLAACIGMGLLIAGRMVRA